MDLRIHLRFTAGFISLPRFSPGLVVPTRPAVLPTVLPNLRETQRTESTSKRLSKPHELQQTTMRRYRTQEVAGSSPASSINEVPAIHSLSSRSSVTSSRVSSPARSNNDETPPIPLTTSAQYQEAAEVAMRERPGLRKGRRFFNVLREM
jgi:hypothetical protein